MYIVLGFYGDHGPGRPRHRPPAELSYATLDEAMQKLRDLVEADEIDDNGPMFTEYGIRIDPLPVGARQEEEARELPPQPFPPSPLKFRRD
jgi:hypothetical protein